MKAIALVTMICFSGCSFFVVRGPGVYTTTDFQKCTEVSGVPVLDAFGAVALAGSSIGQFVDSSTGEEGGLAFYLGAGLALYAIAYTISSAMGFYRMSKCRSSKQQWRKQDRTSRLIDQAIHSSSY